VELSFGEDSLSSRWPISSVVTGRIMETVSRCQCIMEAKTSTSALLVLLCAHSFLRLQELVISTV